MTPPAPSPQDLLDRAAAFARGHGALARWREAWANLAAPDADVLTVGVVGLTSSGKSAFANALMGEALLPEGTSPTTQAPVYCRHGEARELVVRFADGEALTLRGDALTPEAAARYVAPELAPVRPVSALEWRTPAAALPPGFVLVDTPGLDGFGHEALEAVTLSRFLPRADLVVYVQPVRQPLKESDLKLLDALIAHDQQVLFVLSQADLERDSHQGGRLWRSREEKIARAIARLETQLEAHPDLRRQGVIAASSRRALEGFAHRDEAWRDCGFAVVLERLGEMGRALGDTLDEDRARRRLVALADGLDAALASVSAGTATPLEVELTILPSRWNPAPEPVVADWPGALAPRPALPFDLHGQLRALRREVARALGAPSAPLSPERELASRALRPLVAIFRELDFQRAFHGVLQELPGFAEGDGSVLLLGAQRERLLHLVALLAHDLDRLDALEAVPDDHWIAFGEPDLAGVGPVTAIAPPDTLLARLNLAVAPADRDLGALDFPALLSRFRAVGVGLDASRLGSGLSDLERAPYAPALAAQAERSFFACGDGGLFAGDRLCDLVTQVGRAGALGPRPLFVYEDYDARYTHYIQQSRALPGIGAGPRELVRRWRQAGLPLDEPIGEGDIVRLSTMPPMRNP